MKNWMMQAISHCYWMMFRTSSSASTAGVSALASPDMAESSSSVQAFDAQKMFLGTYYYHSKQLQSYFPGNKYFKKHKNRNWAAQQGRLKMDSTTCPNSHQVSSECSTGHKGMIKNTSSQFRLESCFVDIQKIRDTNGYSNTKTPSGGWYTMVYLPLWNISVGMIMDDYSHFFWK